jgi:hypothetical protein
LLSTAQQSEYKIVNLLPNWQSAQWIVALLAGLLLVLFEGSCRRHVRTVIKASQEMVDLREKLTVTTDASQAMAAIHGTGDAGASDRLIGVGIGTAAIDAVSDIRISACSATRAAKNGQQGMPAARVSDRPVYSPRATQITGASSQCASSQSPFAAEYWQPY